MFHQFNNSTTAFAAEVMQNFYHVGSEDRLPMEGSSLEPTNSSSNVGSSGYKWQNIYCGTLYAESSVPTSYIRNITNLYFTTTASSIEITGLNGDSYDYLLSFFVSADSAPTVTETAKIIFNGDSSASYGEKYLLYSNVSIAMSTSSGNNYINITDYINPGFGYFVQVYISAKKGNARTVKCMSYNESATASYITGIWSNSSETLTSLKIIKDIGSTSELLMWRI